MVGEGDFFQDALGAVLVEGGPAAVLALEGEHPVQAPLKALVAPVRVGGGNFAQGQQHHRRVVHVRVPLVVELKHPAARFDGRGVFVLPVSAETDFPVHQPFGATGQRRMIAGQARFVQGDGDDGGVPHRRGARLDAHAVGGLVLQLLQFLLATPDQRMIVRIAQRLEGDVGIEDARKNRRQAVAALKALDHPLLGLFQGELAERMDFQRGEVLGEFMELVQPDEEIAPRKPLRDRGASIKSRS